MSEVIQPTTMTLVSTTATEAVPLWTAGSYDIGERRRLDTTNTIYESLFDDNTDEPPSAKWADAGSTNRYAVFDDSYRTRTTRTSSLTFVISAAAFTNRIALLNLVGTSLTVTVTKGATEVFSKTYSLLNTAGIVDLWTYFYTPYSYIRDLVVMDIPTMSGLTYTITITGPGDVGIGLIRIGRGKYIGKAEYGSSVGNKKFSIPGFDKYGKWTPTSRRPNAKRGSFDMWLSGNDDADDIKSFLDDLDLTLVVFVMTPEFTRGIIWGYANDANFTFLTYGIDKYRLEIEGAT